ncbi:MAG: hypothetical protein CMN29_34930 [Sandaracinus sp.]|nr:hypothetical protein [Sandaracinus sp.]
MWKMSSEVDQENLTVTGRHSEMPSPNVDVDESGDGVIIVVTQAFGPKGDSLVGVSDVTFDDHPAVSVGVRTPDGRDGVVHLSPIHGDPRKEGFTDIAPGTKCELYCPVSKEPLPVLGEVEDGSDAAYRGIFLTPKLDPSAVVMISDVWGHFHSRIVDDMELLSYWAVTHEEKGDD